METTNILEAKEELRLGLISFKKMLLNFFKYYHRNNSLYVIIYSDGAIIYCTNPSIANNFYILENVIYIDTNTYRLIYNKLNNRKIDSSCFLDKRNFIVRKTYNNFLVESKYQYTSILRKANINDILFLYYTIYEIYSNKKATIKTKMDILKVLSNF